MDKYSLNKVILVGRLGREPEVRNTQSDTAVATLSLATSESWKNKNGEKVEKTEWHRVITFGQRAEFAKNYLNKGTMIAVDGKLQTRKWEDKNGNTRYTTEIIANQITILSGQKENTSTPGDQPEEDDEVIPF